MTKNRDIIRQQLFLYRVNVCQRSSSCFGRNSTMRGVSPSRHRLWQLLFCAIFVVVNAEAWGSHLLPLLPADRIDRIRGWAMKTSRRLCIFQKLGNLSWFIMTLMKLKMMKSIILFINRWFILNHILIGLPQNLLVNQVNYMFHQQLPFHLGPGRQPVFLKNTPEFDGRKTSKNLHPLIAKIPPSCVLLQKQSESCSFSWSLRGLQHRIGRCVKL